MSAMLKQFLFITVLVLATCWLASAQEPAATLKFKAPTGWVEEKASSAMRVAQYKLPRETGDGRRCCASRLLLWTGTRRRSGGQH